ncbi:MAG: glutaredoxin family protein [Ardenticatenales bacterium]|nr:glutaredoxin family protein [Ardenticatenales bacterium]
MNKELVMYGRRFACWDQSRAMTFLSEKKIPYRFVDISADPNASARLIEWVGHLSVPTLVIAQPGEVLPMRDPKPLDRSQRVRGQDRDTMITEPNNDELESFLRTHHLL